MVTVKDIRRHLPHPEGKGVSDWTIANFLMLHQALKDAEGEEKDRAHQDGMRALEDE